MITINSLFGQYEIRFLDYSKILKLINPCDIIIIDLNIYNLYKNFNELFPTKNLIKIHAIEKNKSFETAQNIFQKLVNFKANKKTCVYIIGGGITLELGLFCCKVFKRGLKSILVPTTLLSMADVCIGGKSSLNFNQFKNLLGLISPPDQIYIDTKFLTTLNKREINSGLAEVIKSMLLNKKNSFIKKYLHENNFEALIKHSLLSKKYYCQIDEFDKKERYFLNLGHSLGHALESFFNFKYLHGECVLIGTYFSIWYSFQLGLINQKLFYKYQDLLYPYMNLDLISKLKLSYKKNFLTLELVNLIKHDKKMNDVLKFVTLKNEAKPILIDVIINDQFELQLDLFFENFLNLEVP